MQNKAKRPSQVNPRPTIQFNKKRRSSLWWSLPVSFVMLGILAFLGVGVQAQYQQYERFQAMRAVVNRQTFYDGIEVDGMALGGMTYEAALEALRSRDLQVDTAFEIYLEAGETRWRISSSEVPIGRNTESILRQAFAQGRSGTLEERYAKINQIARTGISYQTSMWYDRQAVRILVDIVAARLFIEGHDATVSSFDFDTRSFTFTGEAPGQYVDADSLYTQVLQALDEKRYGETLQVQVVHVEPQTTLAEARAGYGRIAGFATKTTSNKNRNTNISLSTAALNGIVIQPGEILSFNATTGQRTPAKGYREAGAILNGQLVEEVGGGVCQTSSTLYNALIRAGLDIVERRAHAWPSDYVNRGEDAMVDWPDKDLKMQNNTGGPIYIIGTFADNRITFEVYGKLLDKGVTLELSSQTIKTYPPGTPVYTQNPALPRGTEKTIRQARTGYAVDTYLVTLKDGAEISRRLLYRSDYRMYVLEVEYN